VRAGLGGGWWEWEQFVLLDGAGVYSIRKPCIALGSRRASAEAPAFCTAASLTLMAILRFLVGAAVAVVVTCEEGGGGAGCM
jgi:hypothetical protein